jgi:hypothetical protein
MAKDSIGWRHNLGTGVPIAQKRNVTPGVTYTGQIAGSADDHGINANIIESIKTNHLRS